MTKLSNLPTDTTFLLSDLLVKVKAAGGGDMIVTLQNFLNAIGGSTYNPYKFDVYLNASQTVTASTWTKIQLNTKNFDTSSNFDATTNYQFTAPITGYYQFNVSMGASNGGDTSIYAIGINVGTFSSAPTYQTLGNQGGASAPAISYSKLIYLTANQTVQAYGYTASTTIVGSTVAPFYTTFSGFLVSAT